MITNAQYRHAKKMLAEIFKRKKITIDPKGHEALALADRRDINVFRTPDPKTDESDYLPCPRCGDDNMWPGPKDGYPRIKYRGSIDCWTCGLKMSGLNHQKRATKVKEQS